MKLHSKYDKYQMNKKIKKAIGKEVKEFLTKLLTDCNVVIKKTGQVMNNEQLEQIVFGYFELQTEIRQTKKDIEPRILIGDTFYWVRDEFLYDNSNTKVGYIKENGETILTDDPFELGVIF